MAEHSQGRSSFLKAVEVSKTLPLRAAVGGRGGPCPELLPQEALGGPASPSRAAQTCSLCRPRELGGGKKSTGLFCPHRIRCPQSEQVWAALIGWAGPMPPEGASQGRARPRRPLLLLKAMSERL